MNQKTGETSFIMKVLVLLYISFVLLSMVSEGWASPREEVDVSSSRDSFELSAEQSSAYEEMVTNPETQSPLEAKRRKRCCIVCFWCISWNGWFVVICVPVHLIGLTEIWDSQEKLNSWTEVIFLVCKGRSAVLVIIRRYFANIS